MNNENAPPPPRGVGGGAALLSPPPPPLTAAQRSRISSNFRAAKALLARNNNRPLPSPLARCTSSAPPPRRVPLADVPLNRLPTPPITAADDDLDDDFFREVDAICEASAAKKQRRTTENQLGSLQVGISNSVRSIRASNGDSSTRGSVGAGILFQDVECEMSMLKRQQQGAETQLAGNDSFPRSVGEKQRPSTPAMFQDAKCEVSTAKKQRQGADTPVSGSNFTVDRCNSLLQNAKCARSVGENQRLSTSALFLDAKCEMSAAKTQVINSNSRVYRGNNLLHGAERETSRTTNAGTGMERKPLLYGGECGLPQQPGIDVFRGNTYFLKDGKCDSPLAKKQQPNIGMFRDSNFTADRRNSLFQNAECAMSMGENQRPSMPALFLDANCELSAAKKQPSGTETQVMNPNSKVYLGNNLLHSAECETSRTKNAGTRMERKPLIYSGECGLTPQQPITDVSHVARGNNCFFKDAKCDSPMAKKQQQPNIDMFRDSNFTADQRNSLFQNAECAMSMGDNQRPSTLFLDAKCELSSAKKQPSGTETQVMNPNSKVYRGNNLLHSAECETSRTKNAGTGMERKPLLYSGECGLTPQQLGTDVFHVARGDNYLLKDAKCDSPMTKKQQPNIDMFHDSNFTADRMNSPFQNAEYEMPTANKLQRSTDGDSNSVVGGAHGLFSVGVSNSVRPSTESMVVVDGGSNSMGGVGAGILFQDAKCEMPTAEKQRPSTDRDCNSMVDGAQSLLHAGNSNSASVRLTADSSRVFDGDSSVIEGGGNGILFQDAGCESTPRKFKEYFEKLNEAQREAACCDIGTPLMIAAGPGSGKTSTMVGRVLKLLKEGIGPGNILAMTFTTAAASEMRDRIKAVVGKEVAKELAISTFHSFCLKLCRAHAEKLGRTSEFLIYGHGQQRRAVIEALRLLENERKNHKPDEISNGNSAESFKEKSKKWQKFVTKAKASGKTPEEFTTRGDDIGAGVLKHYNDILKSCNALDYHDFISCSMKLLQDFPEVRNECLEMWKAIVVDEFQDTSSMQYHLLKILASHSRVTIVGDDDQSIFSFNGADVCGFDSFRRDFPTHKEIRLNKNYRSTRCIVEAATSLIGNNVKRYQSKKAETDNSTGSRITLKECHNEDAQCSFVVDKILEITSDDSSSTCSFGNVAILYRRQISGKAFQMSFRDRKIPFNIHGVAFYRKKVIKAILAILRTILPGCDDSPSRQAFKALYNGDKEEKKMVIDYIEKVSSARKCSFISAATDIFASKISGTLKRTQLTQGRKVLSTLDMLSKLVQREPSISVIISSVSNMLPQKYLLEKRAIVDAEGGKLLNEDNDLRSVLQYLLDDVSEFLSTHSPTSEVDSGETKSGDKGSVHILKAFLDYLALRESENFRSRRRENENSVTLTTIHQSKGLEWDVVFIVKVNDSEIPLLHEFNGIVNGGTTLEEERRLMYVAMTRARKKLYVLYVLMDSNWQLLQPSRFLKEIPAHLFEIQGENCEITTKESITLSNVKKASPLITSDCKLAHEVSEKDITKDNEHSPIGSLELADISLRNNFLMRFNVEERSVVSHLFHQWAKKPAFQQPKRLLDKVNFVIDERLRNKAYKHKDVMRILKPCLTDDEAFLYAQYVLRWEQIPLDKRAHLMREKQEHFQKLRIENSMGSSEATAKQISYLQSLGCTVKPDSRLHASRLIEQYKSL